MKHRILVLTAPVMTGADVKEAQTRLAEHGWLPKKSIDGKYGPVTANATKRARYRLGFRLSLVHERYDQLLDDFLTGKRKQTLLMRQRAKGRAKKQTHTIGEKAADTMVEWAVAGWKEYPTDSNLVPPLMNLAKNLGAIPYIYRMGFPWCAMSVFTAVLKHGGVSGKTGIKDAAWNALYTPTIQSMAANGRYGLHAVSVKNSITKGVGVLFDFDGGGVDHIGIALGKPGQKVYAANESWSPGRNQVVCVEGNTSYEGSKGSQSNGGCVAVRIRDLSIIASAFTIT